VAEEKKVSTIKKASRYIRDVRSEAKKVHWPSKKTLRNHTAVVLVMMVILGLFIYGVDMLMILLSRLLFS